MKLTIPQLHYLAQGHGQAQASTPPTASNPGERTIDLTKGSAENAVSVLRRYGFG